MNVNIIWEGVNMKYVFEEELEIKIMESEKITTEYINKTNIRNDFFTEIIKRDDSVIYLIAILLKEDSLLNCLSKIKVADALTHLISFEMTSISAIPQNSIKDVVLRIANMDNNGIITDEHLLYGILKNNECLGNKILESFSINTNTMLETVIEYLELENDLFLENISEKYRNNKVSSDEVFIGGERYINKVIRILNKKQKNNCMIIGSAGIGKSALVKEVSKRLAIIGFKSDIYRLDIGSLIAGTRYRGDLEERITQVINKIKDNNGILFIDEIHMLTSQSKSEETLNMANLLKPILSQNDIKCIGTTTTEEYYEYIDKDRAFARRFQNIIMAEPSDEETKKILSKVKSYYEKFYGIKYSKTIIEQIVKFSKYYPNRKNPDKSIDILDETGSYVYSNKQKIVKKTDIRHVIFENICLNKTYDQQRKNKFKNKIITYKELIPFYKKFIEINDDFVNQKENILNINYQGYSIEKLIDEIKLLFGITDEEVINLDLEFVDDNIYNHLLQEVLKNPLMLIVINNYDRASYNMQKRINYLMKNAKEYNSKGQEISFHNTIFIINGNKEINSLGFEVSRNIGYSIEQNIICESKMRKNREIIDVFIREI